MNEESVVRSQETVPRPLFVALAKVKHGLPVIEKGGTHDFHHFNYLQAADIFEALRPLLAAEGVMCVPDRIDYKPEAAKTSQDKASVRHLVEVDWKFVHGASGDEYIVTFPGMALDAEVTGLKKAITASHAGMLANLFEIGGAEPEGAGGQQARPQQRPAARPAAPQDHGNPEDTVGTEKFDGKLTDVKFITAGRNRTVCKIGGEEHVCWHDKGQPTFDELRALDGQWLSVLRLPGGAGKMAKILKINKVGQ